MTNTTRIHLRHILQMCTFTILFMLVFRSTQAFNSTFLDHHFEKIRKAIKYSTKKTNVLKLSPTPKTRKALDNSASLIGFTFFPPSLFLSSLHWSMLVRLHFCHILERPVLMARKTLCRINN